MDRIQDGNQFNHDLPHEHLLDQLGIEIEDLNANLRAKIRRIDDLFAKAMADGYVDENEEKELISESYKVSLEIEKSHGSQTDNTTGALTIIGGIALLFGAAIGIKQLTK